MTEPKNDEGLDTAAIDDGWGDDDPGKYPEGHPELVPAESPAPALPKPVIEAVHKPVPRAPAAPLPSASAASDDDIEFEQDVIARDSMPTVQHPNPLQFDQDPDAKTRVPKPPPLPKFRKKR